MQQLTLQAGTRTAPRIRSFTCNRKFRKRSRYVRSPDMFAIDMVAPPEVRARGPDRTQCGHPGGRWGDGGAAARDLPYSFTFPGSTGPLRETAVTRVRGHEYRLFTSRRFTDPRQLRGYD